MRPRIDLRLTMIFLIAVAFAAVEWGSRDVRFGVTILFVAFVAFLAGRRCQRRWLPTREKPISYEDLVDAETRALTAGERAVELELRLADAYAMVDSAMPRDEDGDVDGFALDDLRPPFDGGFLSAIDHAFAGTQGCLDDEEFEEKRQAALVRFRSPLRLTRW